jgi:hypothetical protein
MCAQINLLVEYVQINLKGVERIIKKYKKKYPDSSFDYFRSKTQESPEFNMYYLKVILLQRN